MNKEVEKEKNRIDEEVKALINVVETYEKSKDIDFISHKLAINDACDKAITKVFEILNLSKKSGFQFYLSKQAIEEAIIGYALLDYLKFLNNIDKPAINSFSVIALREADSVFNLIAYRYVASLDLDLSISEVINEIVDVNNERMKLRDCLLNSIKKRGYKYDWKRRVERALG